MVYVKIFVGIDHLKNWIINEEALLKEMGFGCVSYLLLSVTTHSKKWWWRNLVPECRSLSSNVPSCNRQIRESGRVSYLSSRKRKSYTLFFRDNCRLDVVLVSVCSASCVYVHNERLKENSMFWSFLCEKLIILVYLFTILTRKVDKVSDVFLFLILKSVLDCNFVRTAFDSLITIQTGETDSFVKF